MLTMLLHLQIVDWMSEYEYLSKTDCADNMIQPFNPTSMSLFENIACVWTNFRLVGGICMCKCAWSGKLFVIFFSFVSQSIVLFVGTSNEFELRTGSVCNDCTCYSFVICVILQFKIFSILIEKKTNNDRLCFQWNVPFIYFYVFYFSLAIYGYTRSGKYDWHSQNKYLIANV